MVKFLSLDRGDDGEGAVGHVAVLLVIGAIVTTLLSTGLGGDVTAGITTAICKVSQDDCETPDEDIAAPGEGAGRGRALSARAQGVGSWVLPGAPEAPSDDDGDDDGAPCGAPCRNWFPPLIPDVANYDGGFFEIDDRGPRGYRVYIQQQAGELITGVVHDICAKLSGDDREGTGRCVLAFLRNMNMDGVPSTLRDQLDHLAKSKRWDDVMDAIEDVRNGDDRCLTVDRAWGWGGGTNWSTRGSGDGHCGRGTDPTQGRDTSQVNQLFTFVEDLDDLKLMIEDPEEFVERFPAGARQLALDGIEEFKEAIEGQIDLDAFMADLEEAVD